MKAAIVDTDTISYFFRGNADVVSKIDKYLLDGDPLHLSVVTYYEILSRLYFKYAKNQLIRFARFVEIIQVLPLTTEIATVSAKIYSDLRATGQTLGHNDVLIAGTAVVHGLTLITNNTRHFSRIAKLDIDNWVATG